MPSRAVLRKKQRRDAKRKKSAEGGSCTPSHRIAPPRLGDESTNGSSLSHGAAHQGKSQIDGTKASRKRSHDASSAQSALNSSPPSTGDAGVVAVPKRARREPPPPPVQMPEGLTRKERHRWETSQRLELQMTRLNTTAEAVQEMMADAEAQKAPSGAAAPVEEGAESVAQPGPKLRHDPRFKRGTFWRDRKEKRARTLFLGGIPSYFTVKQVTDFISTVIDSDPSAIDYVVQLGKGKEVVEEVDMLPAKHHGKVKHMYVTMASVPLAGCAATILDRYVMEGRELRCNFAADKMQREEAIRRRSTALR
ncbi:putative RNA binding protein [Leptomonas seymouri]|uniref:Putative RNA binding protein n=1 Tax=Leptomonas seymouri TaxID=5684 RepID=A0A0N1I0N2_LEPSE|nr:putative RNA binding protein [Leptomonas seymouri]|eukprot:KPI88303.1 putative RNA binding protein [Leptomonas seymouri]